MDWSFELCWGTCQGVPLPELIDIAGSTGYASLTIPPELYFLAIRDGFDDAELRQRLADAGTRVSVLEPMAHGLPGIPDPSQVDPVLRSMVAHTEQECYRAATALGAGIISIAHFVGGPGHRAQLIDALGRICENARQWDLQIAIEFIPTTGFPDAFTTAAMMKEVGASNLGLTFDTWHFNRGGGRLEDLPSLDAPITSIQINDAPEPAPRGAYVPMVDRLLPGQGCLEIAEIVTELLPRMADPRIGIEVFNGGLRRMPRRRAARTALTAARTVLGYQHQ